jgi:predicted DNA-binding transcriptional regulator AlpA
MDAENTGETEKKMALSAASLARRLECSVRTLRRWDSSGRLPSPVRIGGRCVRWPVPEIEAWLAAGAPDRKTWGMMKNSMGK